MSHTKLPNLTVVTFSGAHATGKTTLLGDLVERFEDQDDVATTVAESCSQELFRRIREGSVKLPDGSKKPEGYDDLNRLGLRGFFQRALPDALSFEVEAAVLRSIADLPHKPKTVVFVDRWFVDILAYTVVESQDATLHDEVLGLCRSRLDELQSWLASHAEHVRIVNVFVPVKASNFRVGKTAKFRATCDRDLWESACMGRWKDLIPGRRGMLPISTSDRKRRVSQVLDHLGLNQPTSTS